jgi:predicted P-loop ATPase/GTPase
MRLSPFAKNIINEYNGWINYLNKQKEINYRQELKEQLYLENKIAENEKLKHEKDLRQLQIDLANSNIKSNESSVRSIRFSKFIGILTILALITQIVLNQYNESKYKDVKKMEERLQSKTTQLNLYVQKVDSLKTLLSNQNRISQKNTDKLIFSKKD